VVTIRGTGIWWPKKDTVKVRVAENYWSLIPIRRHPSFVETPVKTVALVRAQRKHEKRKEGKCNHNAGRL